MWTGKITAELKELAQQYKKEFQGALTDGYDEICYDAMTYDEFTSYIQEALEKGVELPDVVP